MVFSQGSYIYSRSVQASGSYETVEEAVFVMWLISLISLDVRSTCQGAHEECKMEHARR